MTSIELASATKRYDDASIDVSLSVLSGRQLVLLGPSGCGKTTALRMIAGLVEPDSGEVFFDGRSMHGVRPEHRDAAMVFQEHALFPFRTVGENVEYGLKIRKIAGAERTERVGRALSAVQLHGFEDRWPSDLSGGQRQRVALARAIVVEPRVLLLDEPLSSLDPNLRHDVRQAICSVQRSLGITSVFVTHDRSEARAVADDLAVMLEGRVRQAGPADEVFSSPIDDQVARFLGEGRVMLNKIVDQLNARFPSSVSPTWPLALARIALGVLWLGSLRWKLPPDFASEGETSLREWLELEVEHAAFGFYGELIDSVVLPNFTVFAWLVFLANSPLGCRC